MPAGMEELRSVQLVVTFGHFASIRCSTTVILHKDTTPLHTFVTLVKAHRHGPLSHTVKPLPSHQNEGKTPKPHRPACATARFRLRITTGLHISRCNLQEIAVARPDRSCCNLLNHWLGQLCQSATLNRRCCTACAERSCSHRYKRSCLLQLEAKCGGNTLKNSQQCCSYRSIQSPHRYQQKDTAGNKTSTAACCHVMLAESTAGNKTPQLGAAT